MSNFEVCLFSYNDFYYVREKVMAIVREMQSPPPTMRGFLICDYYISANKRWVILEAWEP